MPHDVWAGIAGSLLLGDVGQVAPCCKATAEEASDAEFWFNVFMRSCWPRSGALLAFAEGGSDDPTRVDWRARLLARAQASPALVVDVGRGYSKYGIVHGVRGRPEGDGLPPQLVQHCSSPTHPPDCDHQELMDFIHVSLDEAFEQAAMDPLHSLRTVAVGGTAPLAAGRMAVLRGLLAKAEFNGRAVRLKKFDEESGRWLADLVPSSHPATSNDSRSQSMAEELPNGLSCKPLNLVPLRSACDLPVLIGEPFAVTASRGRSGQDDVGASSWARAFLARLASHPGPVHIVPQAQMALWSFGVNHGIVVNIGQGQTIAVPVIDGQIGASVACVSDIASGSLTQYMRQLLSRRFAWVDGRHLTFSRDLKEAHCYVAPPSFRSAAVSLETRIAAGEDVGVRPVMVDGPEIRDGRADDFELGVERVLVPELLFDPEMGGTPTLPQLVVKCAADALAGGLCDVEGVCRLFRQVVLVGGAADIPGIRPRTEHELRALLRSNQVPARISAAVTDPNDVFVLNPPLAANGPLTSPRFVPFIGGCVRAVSSERLLPLSPGAQGEEPGLMSMSRGLARVPGFRMWARREFMDLDGPAIFRTGGGGGEDDGIWNVLRLALGQGRNQQNLEEEETEGSDD